MLELEVHIAQGKVTNRYSVSNAIGALKDGKYLFRIFHFRKRTLPQNAYYWGVVIPLVREGLYDAGWDHVKENEDAHDMIKEMFLKSVHTNQKSGEEMILPGSTRILTTTEFCTFIDDIIRWGAEYLGIQIPYPNENLVMLAEYDPETQAIIVEPK